MKVFKNPPETQIQNLSGSTLAMVLSRNCFSLYHSNTSLEYSMHSIVSSGRLWRSYADWQRWHMDADWGGQLGHWLRQVPLSRRLLPGHWAQGLDRQDHQGLLSGDILASSDSISFNLDTTPHIKLCILELTSIDICKYKLCFWAPILNQTFVVGLKSTNCLFDWDRVLYFHKVKWAWKLTRTNN